MITLDSIEDSFTIKLISRRKSKFENIIMKDKNIQSIDYIDNKYIFTYSDGQVFKCSGNLPDACNIVCYSKTIKKRLF